MLCLLRKEKMAEEEEREAGKEVRKEGRAAGGKKEEGKNTTDGESWRGGGIVTRDGEISLWRFFSVLFKHKKVKKITKNFLKRRSLILYLRFTICDKKCEISYVLRHFFIVGGRTADFGGEFEFSFCLRMRSSGGH